MKRELDVSLSPQMYLQAPVYTFAMSAQAKISLTDIATSPHTHVLGVLGSP